MEEELKLITNWLVQASEQIPKDYFKLPVAGQENPIYRERVYCYELYHQWRNQWSDDCRFSLCGEINKNGHRIIRTHTMPDFLVHTPREMKNLLILEVKPVSAQLWRIIEDLKKIAWFRTQIKDNTDNTNYYAGYFLLYGKSKITWEKRRKSIENKINNEIDLKLIQVFIHESYRSKAIPVRWSFQDA